MFETEEAKEVDVILETGGVLIESEVMRELCLSSVEIKNKNG